MTQTVEEARVEVIDNLQAEESQTDIVVAEDNAPTRAVQMDLLQSVGFIAPIAKPEDLRAAFEYQQKMFAAVLADSDYLYTVTFTSDNKSQQRVVTSFDEAEKLREKLQNLGAKVNAKPKKSGIVKLARALGITAQRVKSAGLPDDPRAQYAYVEYEAEHEATGKKEIGVGWCDKQERGGKISTHDVIATADTRAYNRAILRLAGFGDVSADEIIAGASDSIDDLPVEVPEAPKAKAFKDLPAIDDDDVVTAARSWAEAVVERKKSKGEYFAPQAQQDTRAARELRAAARRGSAAAANQLGQLGLNWDGTASDGMGYPTFSVEFSPIMPRDIENAQVAASGTKETTKETGWDLSGKGSDKDDEGLPPDLPDLVSASPDGSIPGPAPGAETITTKQAKNISTLLKKLFSSVDEMKSWLKVNCHVDSTIHITSNQYEPTLSSLKKQLQQKESANG